MIQEQMDAVEAAARRLFRALASADMPAIKKCYALDAAYSDPVFGELGAGSARRIWPFILSSIQNGRWRFEIIDVGLNSAKISSHVDFKFALTGRPVTLQIASRVYACDRLITFHEDEFDLRAWSRMALHIKQRVGLCAPFDLKALALQARKTYSALEEKSCSLPTLEVPASQRPAQAWSLPALASAQPLASSTWPLAKWFERL